MTVNGKRLIKVQRASFFPKRLKALIKMFGNVVKHCRSCLILLTTLVCIFVVEEFFRHIPNSSHDRTLVRIFAKISLTKVMNFAAANENSEINSTREKETRRERRGKQSRKETY